MVFTFIRSFAVKLLLITQVISLFVVSPSIASGPLESFFFRQDEEKEDEIEGENKEPVCKFFFKSRENSKKQASKPHVRKFFFKNPYQEDSDIAQGDDEFLEGEDYEDEGAEFEQDRSLDHCN